MACPKTGITEFRRPFDQGSQTRCHLRLSPLIIDEWRKQMSVHPLRGNVYINQEHLQEEPLLELLKVALM
jgi:hypothetical protein